MAIMSVAEFYVPVFVPKEDLFAAWIDNLHIEKNLDSRGNPNIEIYQVKNGTQSLKSGVPLEETLIGKVIHCYEKEDPCDSEELQKYDELLGIRKSLDKLKERGFRFKLVSLKEH